MPGPVPLKYRAFISYSHADTGWARWLHRGLESFVIDPDLAGRETSTGKVPPRCGPSYATAQTSPPARPSPSRRARRSTRPGR
jgi:hypothetical protein